MTNDWSIKQLDVHNDFLNRSLIETVFTEQSQEFRDVENPGFVGKLQKSSYGLKQSPRALFQRLSLFLQSMALLDKYIHFLVHLYSW